MKTLKTLLFFLFYSCMSFTQSVNDRELDQLADSLAKAVENRMIEQNIAVADFVDIDDKPCKLGKYLSEEFGYTLVNKASKFKVIDRTQLRRLMEEAGIGDKGMVDPKSVQKLGRLEGITALVYGKLIPVGNTVKVYVKVVVLENQVNEINIRGDITRTVTIDKLLGEEEENSKPGSTQTTQIKTSTPYINQNIQIFLKGCSRNGHLVDCELEITSLNKDDIFALKADNTRLIDPGGNTYFASQLFMGNKNNSTLVNQTLRPNSAVTAYVRFANVPSAIQSFYAVELECSSNIAFSFVAQLKNIIVKP